MQCFLVSSRLSVQPDKFWGEQSIATVNVELSPWIYMSAPAAWQSLRLKEWDGSGQLFRSWVLLFGLIPVDCHTFGTIDLSQHMKFVERSSSLFNNIWQHERIAKTVPGGGEVIDKVSFTPRVRWLSPVLRTIYVLVFQHRHAKLRALYAEADDSHG